MAIPTFTQGYPPDGSSLGQTKSTIRNNLDGSFQVFGVDHNDQNAVSNAGLHKQVQIINRSGIPPGLVTGVETLYANVIAGSGELFFTRGNSGVAIQMTGPGVPSAITNGTTFLPGGIVMKWGKVNSPTVAGSVAFAPAFPNNLFSVTFATGRATSTSNNNIFINTDLVFDKTGFSYTVTSSNFTALYWMAIGN